jgi:hypothetical protein
MFVLIINDDPYFWTNRFIEMVVVLVKIRKRFSRISCLLMTQGKYISIGFSILRSRWLVVINYQNDQIIRIDVVLSRGVVEPLLKSSIIAILLKFLFLMRDLSKILSEQHLSTDSFWLSKKSVEWLLKHWQILRVFIFPGNTDSSHFPMIYWELSLSMKNWVFIPLLKTVPRHPSDPW